MNKPMSTGAVGTWSNPARSSTGIGRAVASSGTGRVALLKPAGKTIAPNTITLIREMSRANPLWGAPRIHGELLKLGITLAQRTVAKYMVQRLHRPPALVPSLTSADLC